VLEIVPNKRGHDEKQVLVTGANGLLGIKIVEKLQKEYLVTPTHRCTPFQANSLKLDVTEKRETDKIITKIKPAVIIHTAAETNVDLCEKEPTYAHKVNARGTMNVAKSSQKVGAKVIYISTDYVFDGNKGNYCEADETGPTNVYGFTKLQGEHEVAEHCKNYLILRSSVNFGLHPNRQNFFTWVLTSLGHGEKIRVVKDHFNTPTSTENLAEVIREAIEKDIAGLYHASGTERISRYEFALKIADKLRLPKNLIQPVAMKELKNLGIWIANRPSDSSLNTKKIQHKIDTKLAGIDVALEMIKKEYASSH
jgi:dTDP-4-dehydrorhamnose reductase